MDKKYISVGVDVQLAIDAVNNLIDAIEDLKIKHPELFDKNGQLKEIIDQ